MIDTASAFIAPRLDRAKMRFFRTTAKLSMRDCIRDSLLGELWEVVETGERKCIELDVLGEIARMLDCDPEELLSPPCSPTKLPPEIFTTDSDVPKPTATETEGIRIRIFPPRSNRPRIFQVDYSSVRAKKSDLFSKALTKGVT